MLSEQAFHEALPKTIEEQIIDDREFCRKKEESDRSLDLFYLNY
jgi:hypothetical protein